MTSHKNLRVTLLAFLFAVGCKTAPPASEQATNIDKKPEQSAHQDPPHEENHVVKAEQVNIVVKPDSGHEATKEPAHETKKEEAKTHHTPEGVPAEIALGWLKNGNTRYLSGHLRNDGQSKKDIAKLTKGQKPHTIILSCSDSRVPPEVVFDQKLGEIFVIRTAGETLDAMALGTIEYAVEHLGTQLLVVMGHTSCGAVTAALKTLEGQDAGSPNLNKLVQDIHPRISSFKGQAPTHGIESEVWANTNGVAKDLTSRSDIIANAVKDGHLKIVTSVYYIDSGKVKFE